MIVYTAPEKLAPEWAAAAAKSGRNVVIVADSAVKLRRIFDTTARVIGTDNLRAVTRDHHVWCMLTKAGWTLRFGVHIPREVAPNALVLRALPE